MKFLIFIPFIIFYSSYGQASVSTSGNWSLTRGSTNITDAGLNFDNTALSGVAGETTLSLNGLAKNKIFKVYIRRLDINWHPSLVITATKQADGSVSASNGGVTISVSPTLSSATQVVSTTNSITPFFTASPSSSCNTCNLINLKIRYEISGISVTLPVANYQTQIEYTITDL